MASKEANLEALLYAAGDSGIEEQNLTALLEVDGEELGQIAEKVKQRLVANKDSGIQLIHVAHTYKLTTSPQTAEIIEKYFQKDLTKNLSQSALEILAIVAYRQPITRVEIDDILRIDAARRRCRSSQGGALRGICSRCCLCHRGGAGCPDRGCHRPHTVIRNTRHIR